MGKQVVIMGNYGGSNWGDEAILAGLLASLRDQEREITVVSANPEFSRRLHGENAVAMPPAGFRSFCFQPGALLRFLRVVKTADYLVIGGGGIFQDREWRAVFLWAWYLFWGSRLKTPLLFVAQSVGPLRFPWSRLIARWAFRKADYISVRDAGSVVLLDRLGIQNKNIIQSTDAIFALPIARPSAHRKGTLLALRGDGGVSIQTAKQLIAHLPHPVTAAVLDRADRRFASALGVPVWEPAGIEDLRQTIRAAELVVSARLHGNLIALLEATPFLALAAAPKIQAFFADRGLEQAVLAETATATEAPKTVEAMRANLPKIGEELQQVRSREAQRVATIWPPGFASAPEIRHT